MGSAFETGSAHSSSVQATPGVEDCLELLAVERSGLGGDSDLIALAFTGGSAHGGCWALGPKSYAGPPGSFLKLPGGSQFQS